MPVFRPQPDFFFRLSGWGGALALVGFPISVSLSQAGLVLAVIGWALWTRARRKRPTAGVAPAAAGDRPVWAMPFQAPLLLKIALAVYAFEFVSLVINALLAGSPADIARFFARGLEREFKDVLLVSGAFWMLAYTADPRGERRVFRWLEIAIWVLIASGFFSIFSRFRLSKYPYHMMHGWVGSEIARFQHHLGTFFGETPLQFHIYMPIGFMNTHLTYAALLSFVFPVLTLRLLHPFMSAGTAGWRGIGTGVQSLWRTGKLNLVLFLAAAIVLMLNNGRSALLGLGVALFIALYYFVRVYWGRRFWRVAPFVAGAIAAFVLLVNLSPHIHARFDRIMSALAGQEKHTDYHRTFLWQGTLEIIQEHPLVGVGPGAWNEEIDATLLAFSQKHPRLWYAYQIIQRGHAHNDFLHLVAIAGPLCGLAFLVFIARFLVLVLSPGRTLEYEFWKWGPLMVFFGGLYQCYFQDDEVLLPFWLLVGLALRGVQQARERSDPQGQPALPNEAGS